MITGNFVPEFHHLFCTTHGEPFKDKGKKSKDLSKVMKAFEHWIKNDPMIDIETNGFVLALPSVLAQKPFCCRLVLGQLMDLYRFSDVGVLGECVVCHQSKMGTPYRRLRKAVNFIEVLKHVCFECVVFRSVPNELLTKDM